MAKDERAGAAAAFVSELFASSSSSLVLWSVGFSRNDLLYDSIASMSLPKCCLQYPTRECALSTERENHDESKAEKKAKRLENPSLLRETGLGKKKAVNPSLLRET